MKSMFLRGDQLKNTVLIEKEAAPESDATSIDLLFVQAGFSGSRERSRIQV
jgi:hypothetical protein